ncbi:MAG: hypothetical protein QNM02_04640 [Acidimicrobiia bacterium]|nr:hypothetical protein [Acidimicrobiia bacterium]
MRQLFTWRFLAALGALVGLVFLVDAVVVDDQSLDAVVDPEPTVREIDLVAPIFATVLSADFGLDERGVTSGFLDVVLGEERIVRIAPGTSGEITCEELDVINRCAFFVDLLGDGVVWFAITPQAEGYTAELPEIVDLEGGRAEFVNGWRLPYPPVIERTCRDEDLPTFADFLRRFGPGSITVVDLLTGEVVSAHCTADSGRPRPTTPPTTLNPDQPPEVPVQAPTSAP